MIKKLLSAAVAIMSMISLSAQTSAFVHRSDGETDAYDLTFVERMYGDNHKHYILFSFPASEFEIVSNFDVESQLVWSADATDAQKAVITGIIANMVYVQGGTTFLGAQNENVDLPNYEKYTEAHEAPVHRVSLTSYFMNRYLITRHEWQTIMGAGATDSRLPVDGLSWNDAMAFIDRINELSGLSFRLPTEAEWEYAARGGGSGQQTLFAGGDGIGQLGWTAENAMYTSHEVGQLLPNELGIYDMSGNVLEWCADWYGEYNMLEIENPQGPEAGSEKVLRGGCYLLNSRSARCAFRTKMAPNATTYMGVKIPAGIRLVYNYIEHHDLVIDCTDIVADKTGSVVEIPYSSSDPITSVECPSWIHYTLTDDAVVVEIDANYSGEDRNGQIIIKTDYLEHIVNVSQENLLYIDSYMPTIDEIIAGIEWSDDASEAQKEAILSIVRDMIAVEGGSFIMGSQSESPTLPNYDPYSTAAEQPLHQVNLSSFYLGRIEITRKQWLALMDTDPGYFKWDEALPIDGVSWNMANAFIERINELSTLRFTLPSEAQWEYAARGGNQSQGFVFAGSNDPNSVGYTSANAEGSTRRGGQLAPNELGFYDMMGNVYEWTADWSAPYTEANGEWNPTGPAEGTEKVARGGCQAVDATMARNAARVSYNPAINTIMGIYTLPAGIRLAMDYTEQIDLHLRAEYDTISVNISGVDNIASIKIPQGVDWVKAEIADGKMVVYVQPNYSGDIRTEVFTVEAYTKRLNVRVTQDYREVTLNDVIPPEILDLIEEGEIEIYPGFNPPNIEGVYFVNPQTLVASSLGYDSPGDRYCDAYVKFSNQTSSNTLDFDMYETAGATHTGPGAFITGDNNCFSAFFNTTAIHSDGVTKSTSAIIINGIKTEAGIYEYRYAFVMVSKVDPYNELVPVGTYRQFKDGGDNIAENSTWPLLYAPGRTNAPAAGVERSSLPSILANSKK